MKVKLEMKVKCEKCGSKNVSFTGNYPESEDVPVMIDEDGDFQFDFDRCERIVFSTVWAECDDCDHHWDAREPLDDWSFGDPI